MLKKMIRPLLGGTVLLILLVLWWSNRDPAFNDPFPETMDVAFAEVGLQIVASDEYSFLPDATSSTREVLIQVDTDICAEGDSACLIEFLENVSWVSSVVSMDTGRGVTIRMGLLPASGISCGSVGGPVLAESRHYRVDELLKDSLVVQPGLWYFNFEC